MSPHLPPDWLTRRGAQPEPSAYLIRRDLPNATTQRSGSSMAAVSSSSRPAENLPSTARAIALLLSATPSIQDVQPSVLHQLLEFSHRYTAQVLTDASVYSEHAGRGGKLDMDDVILAVQARVGWEFGGRVPKEV